MLRIIFAMVAITFTWVMAPLPAVAEGLYSSRIVPLLDFPTDTLMICDPSPNPLKDAESDCWEPGREHWLMRMPFGEAQRWVTAQMAELGLEPYSTYNDGPSTSWGKGTDYRVTVEMNHESSDTFTDVYVTDLNFVRGARR